MKQEEIKARRQRVLDYVRQYIREHGYAPAIQDVVQGCDLSSKSVAWGDLKALKEQGRLTWKPDAARTIVVLESAR
jgi:repressor LexA